MPCPRYSSVLLFWLCQKIRSEIKKKTERIVWLLKMIIFPSSGEKENLMKYIFISQPSPMIYSKRTRYSCALVCVCVNVCVRINVHLFIMFWGNVPWEMDITSFRSPIPSLRRPLRSPLSFHSLRPTCLSENVCLCAPVHVLLPTRTHTQALTVFKHIFALVKYCKATDDARRRRHSHTQKISRQSNIEYV